MTLDDLRAAHPDLGLAVYALEPGGPVTLEIHFDGDFRTWTGPTEADVLLQAFPPAAETPESWEHDFRELNDMPAPVAPVDLADVFG